MNRIYNFNAGPATLPLDVLKEVQAELLDFRGSGMSILEISHRSKEFQAVLDDTKADIAELLHLPADYGICFMAGGGTLQFSCVPWRHGRRLRRHGQLLGQGPGGSRKGRGDSSCLLFQGKRL